MCRCQRTSSRNWFPPSTMWVLGSSLGHEVGCNAFRSTEPPVGYGSCYSLSSPPQTFILQTLSTPHSKSEIQLPLLTVSQAQVTVSSLSLFPTLWRIQPQWLLFWTLFCFISQIPRHLAACDFFLWCCERSHDICKEHVCFLKARILSEALEDILLLKGRGGQGRVTGMLPPEPTLPFQALH